MSWDKTNQLGGFDPVTFQILWERLIAVVDEADVALGRTAFSMMVREGHDYVCVLLDPFGRSLAQCTDSIPSFIGTLPFTAKQMLRRYPRDQIDPGDVIVTNDPWAGTGHLPDITMLTPIYLGSKLIGFAGNVAHLPDIGGRQISGDARELFEEGLRVPICKLYKRGKPNTAVFDIIASNVRVPEQVFGDIRAEVAANEVMATRLLELLREYALSDLGPLAEAIHRISETSMRRAIVEIPEGEYSHLVYLDGLEKPLRISAKIRVRAGGITVDYEGSSPQTTGALNSVANYTFAYTAYPLKCILDPRTPNNEGCFAPMRVVAPAGTIVNATFPAAVGARHQIGHILQAAVFGALSQVVPDKIMADSGGAPVWIGNLSGTKENDERFATFVHFSGGQGARPGADGISCLTFPLNATTIPIEVLENEIPVMVERREIICDSGGAGKFRGGCGQRVAMRSLSTTPFMASIMVEKLEHPSSGFLGGRPGRTGRLSISGARSITPKGQTMIYEGDTITFELPGGGGLGDPAERDRESIRRDLANEYVSMEGIRRAYGLIITDWNSQ